MDYANVATAVFTPLEYGAVGMSEEAAYDALGQDNVEVFHTTFAPLEWSLSPEREVGKFPGFAKVSVRVLPRGARGRAAASLPPVAPPSNAPPNVVTLLPSSSLHHPNASLCAPSPLRQVICDKSKGGDKATFPVLGMHYLGPNAGEVIQGYAVAVKMGCDFGALSDTVGIHPTTSEQLTTLKVTKSSGESAAAGGC